MISAPNITEELSALLDGEVKSSVSGGRIALLTPIDYPDREGVVVYIEPAENGVLVTDLGATAAALIGEANEKDAAAAAEAVARRYDVEIEAGTITASASQQNAADACWRVAQAAAMIAAASIYTTPPRPTGQSFRDMLDTAFPSDTVQRNRRLAGASGHEHRVSFFLPATETVVEPVGGAKAWQTARLVYAEFGDLAQVNGYRFHAVIDDRDRLDAAGDERRLLSQVGRVTRWSERDLWLPDLLAQATGRA